MRILTWNIQWGLGGDGLVNPERSARFIEKINPDIIALQEVCNNFPVSTKSSHGNQPEWFSQRFQGYTCLFSAAIDIWLSGERRQFGNLILSRYPVRKVIHHRLPQPADGKHRSSERCALELLIESPIGFLRFTTTHLEYTSSMQRKAQANYLRARHHEASGHAKNHDATLTTELTPMYSLPSPESAVLCGDLNAIPSDEALAILCSQNPTENLALQNCWQVAYPGKPYPLTIGLRSPGFDPAKAACFDYILATEDIVSRLEYMDSDSLIGVSDHQPLWADFRDD